MFCGTIYFNKPTHMFQIKDGTHHILIRFPIIQVLYDTKLKHHKLSTSALYKVHYNYGGITRFVL